MKQRPYVCVCLFAGGVHFPIVFKIGNMQALSQPSFSFPPKCTVGSALIWVKALTAQKGLGEVDSDHVLHLPVFIINITAGKALPLTFNINIQEAFIKYLCSKHFSNNFLYF